MAGLRVAYGVAHPEMRAVMESSLPAWPVDSIAADAARMAVEDQWRVAAARDFNAQERDWLASQLRALGLAVFPSAANYLLLKVDESRDGLEFWRSLVVDHSIVARSCANFEGLGKQYLRVGIRTRSENQRLLHSLSCLLSP
jgi:threonine-phosphate decarboxylase